MISGTPMYMAPEQVLGQTLDHRADLFSLGSVLYELASGRPPFRAANTIAVLRRVSDDTPRPMQEIIPEIPDWLVAIVTKLHAKKPEDRFQSAKEVADLLARCQSELQLTGKVTSLQGRPVAPRQEARTSSDSPKRPDSDAKVDRSLRVCDDLRIPSRSLVRVCGRRDKAPSEHPHSTSRFVAGSPRSQRAVRDQVRIEMRSLDPLPPADDPARVVWEFVRKLDLSEY